MEIRYKEGMRIGMRMLSGETVSWLRDALAAGEVTRGQLARGVCERENWRNDRKQLCLSSASKGLGALAAGGFGVPMVSWTV